MNQSLPQQGPNVADPEARALLAAAEHAMDAGLELLSAVRDGRIPETEEIVQGLADALRLVLVQYEGGDDANQLLGAVLKYLDEEAA
jgi:hypothetical protein